MYFTLKHAYSTRNCDFIVDLDKCGNKYKVCLWDKRQHRSSTILTYDKLEDAQTAFEYLCEEYDMNVIQEADTSAAYSYIASQHD